MSRWSTSSVLSGDVDFLRESTALVKVPLYKENEARGGFTTVLTDMHVDSSILYLNQTFDDERGARSPRMSASARR